MFFRKITTKCNGKEYTYVKLIENYRQGNKVKQRVIANLGNIEDLTPPKIYNMILSLSKVCGLDARPKTQRILRFGDVLAIHKMWEKTGLNQTLPQDVALAIELLIINELINLPKNTLNEWQSHLYLPVQEHLQVDFEKAINHLLEDKKQLQEHILNNLKKNISTSYVYCHMIKGYIEEDISLRHFLSPPSERKQITLAILTTQEGIPVDHKVFLDNAEFDYAQYYKYILVSNHYDKNFEERDYIAGLHISSEEVQRLINKETLSSSPDMYHQFQDDLLYREIKEDKIRYLLCFNPHRAASLQKELENHLQAFESVLLQNKSSILKGSFFQKYFDPDTLQRKESIIKQEIAGYGKYVIKTNIEYLPPEEIINVYNLFVSFKERFRKMKCSPPLTINRIKGHIFINMLAYLIEKLMDHTLHEQGINLDAPTALLLLEPVKITINEMAGRTIPSIITMDKTQRKILSALSTGNLNLATTLNTANDSEKTYVPDT